MTLPQRELFWTMRHIREQGLESHPMVNFSSIPSSRWHLLNLQLLQICTTFPYSSPMDSKGNFTVQEWVSRILYVEAMTKEL